MERRGVAKKSTKTKCEQILESITLNLYLTPALSETDTKDHTNITVRLS